jgi:hypothetical protein
MNNVITLHDQKPMIWVCACGCSTFYALDDGTGECAACNSPHDFDGSGWILRTDDRGYTGDEVFRDVQGNGSVDFARRRVARQAAGDDVVVIVVIKDGGEISTWANVETSEQVEWIERRMSDAVAMIRKRREDAT